MPRPNGSRVLPALLPGDARMLLFDIPRAETELTAMTVELKDGARTDW